MNTNRHHYSKCLCDLLLTLIHRDHFLWHTHVFLQLSHLVLSQFGRTALLDPIGVIVQELQLHRLKKRDGLGCVQIFWFGQKDKKEKFFSRLSLCLVAGVGYQGR